MEPMETIQASFDCSDLENPMGERRKDALRLDFDRKVEGELHGTKVTSDAGLIAYREINDVFGLTDMVACKLRDKKNFLIVQGNFGKFIDVVE